MTFPVYLIIVLVAQILWFAAYSFAIYRADYNDGNFIRRLALSIDHRWEYSSVQHSAASWTLIVFVLAPALAPIPLAFALYPFFA